MEQFSPIYIVIIILLSVWETVWKAFSLWKSARHNQLKWFVALLIVNSLGILPIIYLKFFQKKENRSSNTEQPNTASLPTEITK